MASDLLTCQDHASEGPYDGVLRSAHIALQRPTQPVQNIPCRCDHNCLVGCRCTTLVKAGCDVCVCVCVCVCEWTGGQVWVSGALWSVVNI